MAHIVIWEFLVPESTRAEFERAYGPYESGGEWAALFRAGSGFEGTELLHDRERADHYVTIDRWESASAYAAFKTEFAERYAELDRRCERLTSSERLIGTFGVV